MSEYADLILLSNCIFTATEEIPFSGYIAIKNDRILSIGKGLAPTELIGTNTKYLDYGNKTITPGFSDVHCFFTGYSVGFVGIDLSAATSQEDILNSIKEYAKGIPADKPILGHGWNSDTIQPNGTDLLDEAFSTRPVLLFAKGCETCWMNQAAINRYQFTPETCYPESYVRFLPDLLGDKDFIIPEFKRYIKMMSSKGITSIKEMGFDDFYGFTDVLEEMELNHELTLRIAFMSQPVGAGANLAYAREARERFRGPFVRFSGFNRMTDRGVWAGLAEMIDPYEDTADAGAAGKTVVEEPEWDLIENELRAIDADGFRYSLHCQGDGAVRRTVALYASLPRDEHGRMLRRHAITDLENSDPTDLIEFGKLGGICEVYPQILTLDRREDCLSMMRRQIGETRLLHSWNRRGMEDSGCTVCCGTDLPLLIPSLGESIYSACGGYFDDGLPVNEANVLTLVELLRAWTAGGAYDLMREDELGTLEVGKLADICVLDRDVFDLDYRDARDLAVDMTMSDGQIVFDRNKEA